MPHNYYASEDCHGPSYRPTHQRVHAFTTRSERDAWVADDPDGFRTAATSEDAKRCASHERDIYLHGAAMVPKSWDTDRAWWYRDPREWDIDVYNATRQVFD